MSSRQSSIGALRTIQFRVRATNPDAVNAALRALAVDLARHAWGLDTFGFETRRRGWPPEFGVEIEGPEATFSSVEPIVCQFIETHRTMILRSDAR